MIFLINNNFREIAMSGNLGIAYVKRVTYFSQFANMTLYFSPSQTSKE